MGRVTSDSWVRIGHTARLLAGKLQARRSHGISSQSRGEKARTGSGNDSWQPSANPGPEGHKVIADHALDGGVGRGFVEEKAARDKAVAERNKGASLAEVLVDWEEEPEGVVNEGKRIQVANGGIGCSREGHALQKRPRGSPGNHLTSLVFDGDEAQQDRQIGTAEDEADLLNARGLDAHKSAEKCFLGEHTSDGEDCYQEDEGPAHLAAINCVNEKRNRQHEAERQADDEAKENPNEECEAHGNSALASSTPNPISASMRAHAAMLPVSTIRSQSRSVMLNLAAFVARSLRLMSVIASSGSCAASLDSRGRLARSIPLPSPSRQSLPRWPHMPLAPASRASATPRPSIGYVRSLRPIPPES